MLVPLYLVLALVLVLVLLLLSLPLLSLVLLITAAAVVVSQLQLQVASDPFASLALKKSAVRLTKRRVRSPDAADGWWMVREGGSLPRGRSLTPRQCVPLAQGQLPAVGYTFCACVVRVTSQYSFGALLHLASIAVRY